jgi:phosphate transport system substrate-binding protein
MKNCNRWNSVLVVFLSVVLCSCSNEKRETLTSGSLTMLTSEDVFPVIDIQVSDFQRMYDQVKIKNSSVSSREAIVQLLNDSVKLIVCAREFNQEERSVIAKNELEVDSIKVAYDGIAVVVNQKNSLSRLTTSELQQILSGTVNRWTNVKGSNLSSAVVIAVGEKNSGVHEYLRTRLMNGGEITGDVVPCAVSSDVFKVVNDHPNTIGFVSLAWLSKMPEQLRVLEIGDPAFRRDSSVTELEYFTPHQAHIYRKYYPLSRTIYLYALNVGKGPGLGFMSFAASSDGQKIIVSNGLVPATLPVRLVQLNTP